MAKKIDLDRLGEFKALENGSIATVETGSTASKAYAVGDYFYFKGKLVKATAAITSGGTITLNTNCALAQLADDLVSQSEKIVEVKKSSEADNILLYPDYATLTSNHTGSASSMQSVKREGNYAKFTRTGTGSTYKYFLLYGKSDGTIPVANSANVAVSTFLTNQSATPIILPTRPTQGGVRLKLSIVTLNHSSSETNQAGIYLATYNSETETYVATGEYTLTISGKTVKTMLIDLDTVLPDIIANNNICVVARSRAGATFDAWFNLHYEIETQANSNTATIDKIKPVVGKEIDNFDKDFSRTSGSGLLRVIKTNNNTFQFYGTISGSNRYLNLSIGSAVNQSSEFDYSESQYTIFLPQRTSYYLVVELADGDPMTSANSEPIIVLSSHTKRFATLYLHDFTTAKKEIRVRFTTEDETEYALLVREISGITYSGTYKVSIVEEDDIYLENENAAFAAIRGCPDISNDTTRSYPIFVHITDTHNDAKRVERAFSFARRIGAVGVFGTGDYVDYLTGASSIKFLIDTVAKYKVPFYPCSGNHEQISNTQKEVSELIFQPLQEQAGYTLANVTNPTYWHKDLVDLGIRIISINQFEDSLSEWVYNITQEQIDWICSTINETPQNYGIIVLRHTTEKKIVREESVAKFCERSTVNPYLMNTITTDIVDAYLSGTTINKTYPLYGSASTADTVTVDYDFSSKNSGTEFIAFLDGHLHKDLVHYENETTNAILDLNATCTALMTYNGDLARINYSPTQDAFNAYVIDRDRKVVKIVRLGSHLNFNFTTDRNYLEIPYAPT